MTFSGPSDAIPEFLNWMRVEGGAARHTLTAYRADLELYAAELPGCDPLRATPEHVLDFVAGEAARGMAAST